MTASHASADVTYQYTGNPFDRSDTPPGRIGDWIIASVTFSNPSITSTFSGDVYGNSVSQWSISVAQKPAVQLDSTNSISDPRFPLWFHFDNGNITNWQLEAHPSLTVDTPEIYTTHNSPSSGIRPTADFYIPTIPRGSNDGYNVNQPGTWAVVPIPAAFWLFGSALAGLGLIGKGRKR